MPKARRNRDRWRQIYNWLKAEFPTPCPTRLHIRKGDDPSDFGESYRYEGEQEVVIRLSPNLPRSVGIDTLLHEYAHICCWWHPETADYIVDHGPEWGVAYARLVQRFIDDDGHEASADYPW